MLPFSKLGLASSVAKTSNYSWRKTIEYARRLSFNQVQLYLNSTDFTTAHIEFLIKVHKEFKLHLHLPPYFNPQKMNSFLQRLDLHIDDPVILIQHQCFSEQLWQLAAPFNHLQIAIENDLSQGTVNQFSNFLLTGWQAGKFFLPVLDIPRFFHQAPSSFDFNTITKEIFKLITEIQTLQIPFIVHAIDHNPAGTEREHWQPLFTGVLPWKEVLKIVSHHQYLLKCFMFEYENWDMVEQSVRNMIDKKFLKQID